MLERIKEAKAQNSKFEMEINEPLIDQLSPVNNVMDDESISPLKFDFYRER